MKGFHYLVLLGVVGLLVDRPLPAQDALDRIPVPDTNTELKAREVVREVYGDQYKRAATIDQKRALAVDMFNRAMATDDDPAGRYALLKVAENIAAQIADVELAGRIVDETAIRYDIPALSTKLQMLKTLAKTVTDDRSQALVLHRAMQLVTDAATQDDYQSAKESMEIALTATQRLRDTEQMNRLEEVKRRLEEVATAYEDVKECVDRLKQNPNDPQANLTSGKFCCWVKGDWERGLQFLSRGSDEVLRILAQKELQGVSTITEQVELADGWWDLAQSSDHFQRLSCSLRAGYWYRNALQESTGLTQAKITTRLEAISEIMQAFGLSSGPMPGRFDARTPEVRNKMLAVQGGTAQTEAAVARGLKWLASVQRQDGSWSLVGPYSDGAANDNPVAATAMAILALQGAGETPRAGVFRDSLAAGWNWLLKRQDDDGNFFHEGAFHHRYYTNALCSIAICEVFGMTTDPSYREPAERAIRYLLRSQSVEGGWRYSPQSDSDISVTGWVVAALHTARMAGLAVPEDNLRGITRYLDRVALDGGARYPYQKGKEATLTMTAAGLLCRLHLGWRANDRRLLDGAQWIVRPENLINYKKGRNVYYWYYASQVCHYLQGEYWRTWNSTMRQAVPEQQILEGSEAGSWDPIRPTRDAWEAHGGRLYVTCLSILLLETYYRHLPLSSSVGN